MTTTCAETCRNLPAGKHSPHCPDRVKAECGTCGHDCYQDEITYCLDCESPKCPCCDMGDDVPCLNCEDE